MKRLFAVCLFIVLVALVGCESRSGRSQSSSGPSSSLPPEPPSVSVEPPSSSALPEPSSSSASSRPAVDDPEQVSEAKEIVSALLGRAATADEIFRAALRRDPLSGPTPLGEKEYIPVIDDRFLTVDDIKVFWNETFTKGGRATEAFEELQEELVYVSVNGELFVLGEQRQIPLTLGGWRLETFELLLLDDRELECRMQTTFLGKDNDEAVLRIVRDGDVWLLGDSYFLD